MNRLGLLGVRATIALARYGVRLMLQSCLRHRVMRSHFPCGGPLFESLELLLACLSMRVHVCSIAMGADLCWDCVAVIVRASLSPAII